jgi:hypothetical protein
MAVRQGSSCGVEAELEPSPAMRLPAGIRWCAAAGGTGDPVHTNAKTQSEHSATRGALLVGALGVVFGDIGTSPLHTVQTVFSPSDPHPVTATTDSVSGSSR